MQPATTRTALKEWAVACDALEQGRQILLLRKGGIREIRRDFSLEHADFLLYPTFEHQREDLLKPAYRPDLVATLGRRETPDQVEVRLWASVTDAFEISESVQLEALREQHCWSDTYAQERLRWKPRHPLHVLALRAYRLPTPAVIQVRPEYAGCSSWVSLAEAVGLEGARPVLSDEVYAERVAAAREALARVAAEEQPA